MQEEILTGDNKWNAEGHGLQEARKQTLFRELPPVLQLHLGRFRFDRHTGMPSTVLHLSSHLTPHPPQLWAAHGYIDLIDVAGRVVNINGEAASCFAKSSCFFEQGLDRAMCIDAGQCV